MDQETKSILPLCAQATRIEIGPQTNTYFAIKSLCESSSFERHSAVVELDLKWERKQDQ
jgi:hypothetical protein